ncbi:MAG TPA: TldD/PmbA family protein [Candidatus Xenobia bacterium]|nr:TldD/PmbA family protein [Candidatus Xenobia bacterium]
MPTRDLELLPERLLKQAQRAGAQDAEVWVQESTRFVTHLRHGNVEELTEATTRSVHLRVFVEQRVGRASSSDLRSKELAALAKRAVEHAWKSHADPFAGLPEKTGAVPPSQGLDLYDPELETMTSAEKVALAREAERIGLSLDPQVKNSGGAGFSTTRGQVWLANTRGFFNGYKASSCSLSLYLLGHERGRAEQVSDYWDSVSRHRARLESPEQVARKTVERVRRHFGAKKVGTAEVPVIFEPLLAADLLSDIFGAVRGEAIYLRRSFLADQLGRKIAADGVTIVDDGLLPGGIGTRPFDREGMPSQRTLVVEKGVLRNYLCGSYSARKLKLKSTGNGTGDGEAPTNFHLAAGPHAPEAIVGSVKKGLYLTRLIGQGVNLVTGDYSRGAFGLWIEDGHFVHPVREITISSNLRAMLEGMEMVGNDLELRDQFSAPTVKIAAMTVAGT